MRVHFRLLIKPRMNVIIYSVFNECHTYHILNSGMFWINYWAFFEDYVRMLNYESISRIDWIEIPSFERNKNPPVIMVGGTSLHLHIIFNTPLIINIIYSLLYSMAGIIFLVECLWSSIINLMQAYLVKKLA